jgi:hypothetical protein
VTFHLHVVSRFKMNGGIPPFILYAFVSWTELVHLRFFHCKSLALRMPRASAASSSSRLLSGSDCLLWTGALSRPIALNLHDKYLPRIITYCPFNQVTWLGAGEVSITRVTATFILRLVLKQCVF